MRKMGTQNTFSMGGWKGDSFKCIKVLSLHQPPPNTYQTPTPAAQPFTLNSTLGRCSDLCVLELPALKPGQVLFFKRRQTPQRIDFSVEHVEPAGVNDTSTNTPTNTSEQ
jgi:hypothetical protein